MQLRHFLLTVLLLVGSLVAAARGEAGGTVRLELVGDAQGSAMLFQEWAQALGQAGIPNVHIRVSQDSDKLGIETQGAGNSLTYVVTGSIRSRDELLLPGGRFRRNELGRLAQWLKDLAERGPEADSGEKAPFGLSAAQFQKVRADLSSSVGFPTQGVARRQVAEKIASHLKLPLRLDSAAARALGDGKVADDLSELSCGTALACVLGSTGYCFMPSARGGELSYSVVKADPKLAAWPIGWPMEKPVNESLPALFESLNVNVQNVPVAEALEAIGKRVKAPVLIDHGALARNEIDPATAMVTLPRSRTTYSIALRKLLFQARLKFEVRRDETGAPFLWVTPLKSG